MMVAAAWSVFGEKKKKLIDTTQRIIYFLDNHYGTYMYVHVHVCMYCICIWPTWSRGMASDLMQSMRGRMKGLSLGGREGPLRGRVTRAPATQLCTLVWSSWCSSCSCPRLVSRPRRSPSSSCAHAHARVRVAVLTRVI